MGGLPEGNRGVRIVVCDTGPILHLREAGALTLLAKAGEVLVPPGVDREMTVHDPEWPRSRPDWLRVARLSDEDSRQAERWRGIGGWGPGEAQAIALARSVRADWLLTDDAGARVVASLLGLEVHGSLGVVLWAAAGQHLRRDEALAALDGLAKSSLWISARVLDEARHALERIFS